MLLSVSVPRLAEHRLRTSLTALGIALGVAMLVAVVVVNDSLMRGILATVDDLAGKTDLQISAGTSGVSEALVERVRAVQGVARAVPVLQQTVTVREPRIRGERLLVMGVDLLENDDAAFRTYGSPELEAIRNDPVPFLNSPNNILISRSFAERYGYKLHDRVPLATASATGPFEIWGFRDDSGVGRAFAGALAVMYHQAMQVAFDRGQNLDRIDVAIAPGAELAVVEQRLRAELGSGFIVEHPARKGDRVGKMLLGVRTGLTIASLIAVLQPDLQPGPSARAGGAGGGRTRHHQHPARQRARPRARDRGVTCARHAAQAGQTHDRRGRRTDRRARHGRESRAGQRARARPARPHQTGWYVPFRFA